MPTKPAYAVSGLNSRPIDIFESFPTASEPQTQLQEGFVESFCTLVIQLQEGLKRTHNEL